MEIQCPKCLKLFKPNKQEEKRILGAVERKQNLIMTDCTLCYKSVPINSYNLTDTIELRNEPVINCPICKDGIVSYINDGKEKFWGCGECGNVWYKIEDIKTADKITK